MSGLAQMGFGLLVLAKFEIHPAEIGMAEGEIGPLPQRSDQRLYRQGITAFARIGCGEGIVEGKGRRVPGQASGTGGDGFLGKAEFKRRLG